MKINMSLKRCRSTNWTEEEKKLLIGVLRDYSTIIENKCLKTNSNRAKSTAWEEVHKRFNELNTRPRELNQLQIQWKGMKIMARKNVSTNKREVKGTGGGPRPDSPNSGDIEVTDLLNPGELLRDSNIYDSDGPLHTPDSQPDIITVENTENESQVTLSSQPEIILVANMENNSQVTLFDSQPNSILVENMENVNPVPSTSAIRPSPNLHLARSVSRKLLKTPSRNGRNPMLANTQRVTKDQEYINEMISISKSLKDDEHKKRMEMAADEHKMQMKILHQNLLNAQGEGEIIKLKKILLEMEVRQKQ